MAPTFEERARAIRESPEARRAAWEAGQLWWLLHEAQFRMYRQFYASTADQVWNCARRLGKTFLLVVLMFEACLRKPRARTALGAMQAVDVEDIIEPMVEEILDTCPDHLRPVPRWSKHRIEWPNGSVNKIAGCDNKNYKHLRGRGLDLWAVDEAAFVAELLKVVDDVLSPQTWTTSGRGLLASSPPDTPGHPFQTYYMRAMGRGNSARFTFDQNPLLTPERKAAIIAEEAAKRRMTVEEFRTTTVFRREFNAEFVIEQTRAVLPEFTEDLAEALTCPETSTPLFTDWYTIVDTGGSRDPTGILIGYWDFGRRKFRCQRDRLLQRPTIEEIAKAAKALEAETFSQHPELRGRHYRIVDDDQGFIRRDLAQKYAFPSSPPLKDDKQAGLMDLRDSLLRGEIEFDPACRETLAQCQAAIWNKAHTEYERVEGFGHFDLLDCLLYASRNFIPNRGRVPPLYGVDRANTIIRPRAPQLPQAAQALKSLFGGR
jgi:hypothetical protein